MREPVRNVSAPSIPPITACINVYQDVQWLEKCLKSLLEPTRKVEQIVVVDGAYEAFPHEKPWSTDGTVPLAEALADVVVVPEEAWPNEIIKRNYYLQYVPNDHWWLRIDADEELAGDFNQFAPEPKDLVYCLQLERTDGTTGYPIHALFRKGDTSRYYGTHHAVWYGIFLLVKREPGTPQCPIFAQAHLVHHHSERCQERSEKKGEYYREFLQLSEREFRGKWRL